MQIWAEAQEKRTSSRSVYLAACPLSLCIKTQRRQDFTVGRRDYVENPDPRLFANFGDYS